MVRVYLSTPRGRRVGRRFNVVFRGQRILHDVVGDPGRRTAEALLKLGYTGYMAVIAGGRVRHVLDIEKTAGGRWRPVLERNIPLNGRRAPSRKRESAAFYG